MAPLALSITMHMLRGTLRRSVVKQCPAGADVTGWRLLCAQVGLQRGSFLDDAAGEVAAAATPRPLMRRLTHLRMGSPAAMSRAATRPTPLSLLMGLTLTALQSMLEALHRPWNSASTGGGGGGSGAAAAAAAAAAPAEACTAAACLACGRLRGWVVANTSLLAHQVMRLCMLLPHTCILLLAVIWHRPDG